MAIAAIAKRYHVRQAKSAFRSYVAEAQIGFERIILMQPQTYMNDSGLAVREAAQFRKIPPHRIMVFHDEIELPPGRVRVKVGGSDAGHNGLRSITEHIGSDYCRVRIGVGRPRSKELVHPYVLSNFAKSEWPWVEALCDVIAENAELLTEGNDASFAKFQNKVFLSMEAKFPIGK
jgi:PTH1 family peptidyl-tRNA hydrolase